MKKLFKSKWKWALILPAALVLTALVWIGVRYAVVMKARTPALEYDPGVWYEFTPEGAVTAAGEPLTARIRVGTENKVIVFFFGGGISLNEYTAARPYLGLWIDREPGFYSDDAGDQLDSYGELGIASRQANNPFRDWSIVILPYTTGDFHIGDSEFPYTALDGTERVLHHHGYQNYRAILDETVKHTGSAPEELLIAGWSAGGYGAAILADDIMENYYPDAGHVTVCVDSSLLILDNWREVAEEVWNAPAEITEKMHTENLVVDFLTALYQEHGDELTYLYIGSVRDGALAKYQAYFDTGVYATGNRTVWVYTEYLRQMVKQLQDNVPTIGIYLFDQLPFSWNLFQNQLTQHTILETQSGFWKLTGGTSAIDWVYDSIRGEPRTLGLEKLRTGFVFFPPW